MGSYERETGEVLFAAAPGAGGTVYIGGSGGHFLCDAVPCVTSGGGHTAAAADLFGGAERKAVRDQL